MSDQVTIFCAGGCGRSVTVRKARIKPADFYVCDTRADGARCRASLPVRPPGTIAVSAFNAAGSFMGVTYKVPSQDEHAALARAQRLERSTRGVGDRGELHAIRGGKG